MEKTDQFIALGPAPVGFQTDGSEIGFGADVQGTSIGARCQGETQGVLGQGRIGALGNGDEAGVVGLIGIPPDPITPSPFSDVSFGPFDTHVAPPGFQRFEIPKPIASGPAQVGRGAVIGVSGPDAVDSTDPGAVQGAAGVIGYNVGSHDGHGFGVYGRCEAPKGGGVGGQSASGVGVRGLSSVNDGLVGISAIRDQDVPVLDDQHSRTSLDVRVPSGAAGVLGFSEAKEGVGVLGLSDNEFAVGVVGSSVNGVGVLGTSMNSRGGIFQSAGGKTAGSPLVPQVQLVPQFMPVGATLPAAPQEFIAKELLTLPKSGRRGDMLVTQDHRDPSKAEDPTPSCNLWLCVQGNERGPAQWCQVLLGRRVPGGV